MVEEEEVEEGWEVGVEEGGLWASGLAVVAGSLEVEGGEEREEEAETDSWPVHMHDSGYGQIATFRHTCGCDRIHA